MTASGQTTSTLSPACSPMICPAIPSASLLVSVTGCSPRDCASSAAVCFALRLAAHVDRLEAVRSIGGGELLRKLLRLLLAGGRERRVVDRAQLLARGRHDDHDGVRVRLVQEQPDTQHRQRTQQDQPDRGEKRTAAAGDGGGAHGRKGLDVASGMLRLAYGNDVAPPRGNVQRRHICPPHPATPGADRRAPAPPRTMPLRRAPQFSRARIRNMPASRES